MEARIGRPPAARHLRKGRRFRHRDGPGAGKEGLLFVTGPNQIRGDLGKPNLTRDANRDGWYVTGDIATIDESGFIRVTNRVSLRRAGCHSKRAPIGVIIDGRARYQDLAPEICRFFWIVIRMFVEPGAPHHRPHSHAYYQEASAVYAVDSIECIGGSLSRTQSRLVEAWAELHREELLKDWELLQSGHPAMKIAPLQ